MGTHQRWESHIPHQTWPVLLPPEASGSLGWSPGVSFPRAEAAPSPPAAEPPLGGEELGLSPHDLTPSPRSRCQRGHTLSLVPSAPYLFMASAPQPPDLRGGLGEAAELAGCPGDGLASGSVGCGITSFEKTKALGV